MQNFVVMVSVGWWYWFLGQVCSTQYSIQDIRFTEFENLLVSSIAEARNTCTASRNLTDRILITLHTDELLDFFFTTLKLHQGKLSAFNPLCTLFKCSTYLQDYLNYYK